MAKRPNSKAYAAIRAMVRDVEDLIENLAAVCNHAENRQLEEKLDTIYKKLVKVLG